MISFSTSRLIGIVITLILVALVFQLYFLDEKLVENHLLEKDVENIARLMDHVSSSSFRNSIRYDPEFKGKLRAQGNMLIFQTKKGNSTAFVAGNLINQPEINDTILINKTKGGVIIK